MPLPVRLGKDHFHDNLVSVSTLKESEFGEYVDGWCITEAEVNEIKSILVEEHKLILTHLRLWMFVTSMLD